MKQAREYLFIALDQMDPQEALHLAKRLAPEVGGFKVGMELFYKGGPDSVAAIAGFGREVFLDLKLHDIPQTVGQAVAAVGRIGARYLTVHLSGGFEMLRRASEAAAGTGVTLLGVTLLTSLDAAGAKEVGLQGTPAEIATRLAQVGERAGIEGFVTSGEELPRLRALLPGATIAVPGVRRTSDSLLDQRRVVTPALARRNGADILVVGRPVVHAEDPVRAARAFVEEIAEGESA